jgi:transcriptional/translational regulatory protein YebC/TACO1
MVPKVMMELDEKTQHQVLKLLDALEELEDVQRVYSNADFTDEAMESYEG